MSPKRILLSLLFASFAFFSLVTIVKAQADTKQLQQEFESAASDDRTNYQQTMFNSTLFVTHSLNTLMGGCVGQDCPQGVADGAVRGLSKAVAMTFHQPADTRSYIADLLQDMNIAQPAYAQGVGFASLTPLLDIWKIFRNIAYVFFVIIFLIIGFAIMFRQNLGGQAAVTVQQALPRIIVALLMVTFSYAIAGLLIDLMYISMFFLVAVFSSSASLSSVLGGMEILSDNIFGVYARIITSNFAGSSGAVISQLVEEMLSGSGGLGDFLAGVAAGIAGVLGTLIIFFAILFAMFRTFFALAKVYIEIILSIAFAPVILMMGAIQSNVFGNWVKGLAANLAVFPAMLVFIIIGYLLVGGEQAQITRDLNEGGFVPPFLPGRGSVNTIGLVAGIGAIMLLPEVPGIMARFKPKGLFDDLGNMAMKNAMAGKGAALTVAATPLAAVGGYAGYQYGKSKAKELGLEGRAKTMAQVGGMFAGAGIGLKAPSIVRKAVPGVLGQLGQAQAVKYMHDVEQSAATRRAAAEAERKAGMVTTETTAKDGATDPRAGKVSKSGDRTTKGL